MEADAAKIISETKKVSAPAKPKQMIPQTPVVVVAAGQVDAPIVTPIPPITPITTPIVAPITPITPISTVTPGPVVVA